MTTQVDSAVKIIQKALGDLTPKMAIVLGSGLGGLADRLTDPVVLDYENLPGFPTPSVKGHSGQLIAGTLKGTPVICLKGRAHPYEGQEATDCIKTYVRTLKLLGCEYYIATNAAGSLHAALGAGSLVLVSDHINFQGMNPLIGPNQDEFGPRFLPVDQLYDREIRHKLHHYAEALNIPLHEGVYIAVLGPNYETAAEIRAFRTLGADLVGMSTVPEVLVAHHAGMRVCVISTVTNLATGLAQMSHDHNAVLETAAHAAEKLTSLLEAFAADLAKAK